VVTPIDTEASQSSAEKPQLVPISAKTPEALPQVALRLARHLEQQHEQQLGDIAFTYQTGKSHFAYRAAFAAASRAELVAQARAFAASPPATGTTVTLPPEERRSSPRVAFLFSGQGSQYAGMGAELYRVSPVFQEAIDRCAAVLDRLLSRPLKTILFDRSLQGLVNETELTQPALFALEYALAQQWMSWGFKPDVVLGHSLGELVAACVAGSFSVEDACSLIFYRGSLMQSLCKRGEMLSVAATVEQLAPLLERCGDRVVLSVVNGPDKVVVGGEGTAISEFCKELEGRGFAFRRLHVSHAFHSSLMEPMLEPFAQRVAAVRLSPLKIPLISNLDGQRLEGAVLDASYWARQIRQPVRFSSCLETLSQLKCDLVIEIGPHPLLSRLAEQMFQGGAATLASLHRDENDLVALYKGLDRIYRAGFNVPWVQLHAGRTPVRVHVPTYPFQRRLYSLDFFEERAIAAAPTASPRQPERRFAEDSDLGAIEAAITTIWREVLGAPQATRASDFSELGADSLDSVRLLGRVKQTMLVPLSIEELFKRRTPAAVALLVQERLAAGQQLPEAADGSSSHASQQRSPVQVAQPLVVAAAPNPMTTVPHREVSPNMTTRPVPSSLSRVLVTGATGSLGAHIVKELLDTTESRVYCLLERGTESLLDEAFASCFGHGLHPRLRERIQVVAGNVTQVGVGLEASELRALGEQLDAVIHCAEVTATEALLRFVSEHPRVRFHHVSSLRIAGALPTDHDESSFSEEDLDRGQQLQELRSVAELQAEKLVRGTPLKTPATIYRVGNLVGHSTTGRAARDLSGSALYQGLKAMMEHGVAAAHFGFLDLTPVEYAASAIVALAGRADSASRTFHVCNPRQLDDLALCDGLRAMGYAITEVTRELHAEVVGASPLEGFRSSVRFTCEGTRPLLEAEGIHCPLPDRELLFRLVRFGIESEVFPKPPRWALLMRALGSEVRQATPAADALAARLRTAAREPLDPTQLFNGFIGANVAYAFVRIGLFDKLKPKMHASGEQLAEQIGCIPSRLEALLQTGIVLGYVSRDAQGLYSWTESGEELGRHCGYFTWGVGGYGKFFSELAQLSMEKNTWYHLRDNRMVALGSDQANRAFMREQIHSALKQVKFSRVADLGCGNAGRLLEFCGLLPSITGVGIDVSPEAIALAQHNVAAHGFEQRIQLHCQNVLQAVSDEGLRESLKDVDMVSCFMMLHDLFNVADLKDDLFDRLRAAFPNVKYFLIADTVQMGDRHEPNEPPIFNVGFELAHSFMDVRIHQKNSYDEAFKKAGLELEQCIELGTPNTFLYVLRA